MERVYPALIFDVERDSFVVWVRWVSLEAPPSPEVPPAQGIRVELLLNRNTVLGPTIVYRRDLSAPVYLRAQRIRVAQALEGAQRRGFCDVNLVIHGSIANAPFAALYHLRDYEGAAIDTKTIEGTPLLQLQPSTPADRWQVAAQANLRVRVELRGQPRHRLLVIR